MKDYVHTADMCQSEIFFSFSSYLIILFYFISSHVLSQLHTTQSRYSSEILQPISHNKVLCPSPPHPPLQHTHAHAQACTRPHTHSSFPHGRSPLAGLMTPHPLPLLSHSGWESQQQADVISALCILYSFVFF